MIGASGFIGAWVARALVARGDAVLLLARDVDALGRVWPPVAKTGHASPVRDVPVPGGRGVTVARGDVTAPASIERTLRDFAPEAVFNLVGYGVDRGERDDGLARAINADFPPELARCTAGIGARLVHVGSALEYGTASGDLREDTRPLPTTPYGITKLAGTEGVRAVARASASFALTARLFTVYGPGEHAGRLLPSLVDAAPGEAEIPLSPGTQRRDFAYVEDVAEGLLRLAESDARPGEPVNLCTGTLHTVREFAEAAADVLGIAPSRLAFGAVPARPEEMAHSPVCVTRLRALIGWVPEPALRLGIGRAVARQRPPQGRA